jgi:hypothetical protein
MHSLLVTTVLVSGLTAGDDGGARATAPAVGVDFSGDWVGTLTGQELLAELRLTGGMMRVVWKKAPCLAGGPRSYQCSLVAEDERTVRMTLDGQTSRGAYKVKGRQVRLYFREGTVLVLQRPGPKK